VDEAIEKTVTDCMFSSDYFFRIEIFNRKNYVERAVLKAIENKIAIYAIHTAFDNDFFGVNHGICDQLGLKNIKILQPKKNNLKQLTVFVPKDYSEK
jgi:putative NIF3 family GTP cyclohydrolase 1 type 2